MVDFHILDIPTKGRSKTSAGMADVEARGLAAVAFVRVEAPQVEIAMAAAAQKDQAGRDRVEVDPANLAYVEEGVEVMKDASGVTSSWCVAKYAKLKQGGINY